MGLKEEAAKSSDATGSQPGKMTTSGENRNLMTKRWVWFSGAVSGQE